jgi:acyl-coenzyme A synthetase/AMP-(fatty) acid ligase
MDSFSTLDAEKRQVRTPQRRGLVFGFTSGTTGMPKVVVILIAVIH